nr:hypothetical protein DWY41_09375 [Bacteroides sp. AF25-17LB]
MPSNYSAISHVKTIILLPEVYHIAGIHDNKEINRKFELLFWVIFSNSSSAFLIQTVDFQVYSIAE